MYDLSVEIDGVIIRKKDATIKDYTNLLEYTEQYKGENFLANKDAFLGAVNLVSEWFGVGADKIEERYSLKEVLNLYKKIESNITEVFTGMPLKTTINRFKEVLKTK